MKKTMAAAFAAVALGALEGFADIKAVTPAMPDSEWALRWWPKRFAEKDKLVKAGGAKYVFIGDSITQLFENGAGRAVWERYFGKDGLYPSLNLGFSGDRTEHVLYRIANGELDGYEAKVVVLMIGTNNTGHRKIEEEPPADTVLGVKRCVEAIRAKQPKAKIVLTAVFPRDATVDGPNRVRNAVVNREIRAIADGRHVVWCDINQRFMRPDGFLPLAMFPDRLHPARLGYEIWANAVLPYFEGSSAATLPPFVAPDEMNDEGLVPVARVEDAAWFARLERNRNAVSSFKDGAVDIVLLGDAMTRAGTKADAASATGLVTAGDKTYTTLDAGYDGDGMANLLWRVQYGELAGYKAKIFVVAFDAGVCSRDEPEKVAAAYRRLVSEIWVRHQDAKIMLVAVPPRGAKADDGVSVSTRAVSAMTRTYVNQYTVRWCDPAAKLAKADGTYDPANFTADGKLSDAGARLWRAALEAAIAQEL